MISLIAFTWLASPVVPPVGPVDDPIIARTNGRISVEFGKGQRLTFGRRPFGLCEIRIAGLSIESTSGVDYALNDGACRVSESQARVEDGAFVVDLRLTSPTGDRRATERFAPLEFHGAVGYERRLEAREPEDRRNPGPKEVATLSYARPSFAGVRHWRTHFDHYGFSTVSTSGITYTLRSAKRDDGGRIWVFRSGLHFMNQAVNMDGRDPALTEVVLVEPEGAEPLAPRLFVVAYVTRPIDRLELLGELGTEKTATESREAVGEGGG